MLIESKKSNRVVLASTLAFTMLFAVWVIFGIIGVAFKKEFNLTNEQFFTLTSIPILIGSLFRLPIGILSDKYGGKNMMVSLLLVSAIPMFLLTAVHDFVQIEILAFFVGLSGISFSIGNSWIMFWKPPQTQGLALGTFGAGNVGASITKVIAPLLIALPSLGLAFVPVGWRLVPFIFGFLMLATAAFVFFYSPQDKVNDSPKPLIAWLEPLKLLQVWRYGFYYVVFFGAYVALSVTFPKYYVDVYHLDLGTSGVLTALFIFPASLLRPFGGYLSDRFGARTIIMGAFVTVVAACGLLTISSLPLPVFIGLTLLLGMGMGIGKASNFKLVAQNYPKDMGVVGGLVGMLGGMGGWILQMLFGTTGGWYVGMPFVLLGIVSVLSVIMFYANMVRIKRSERVLGLDMAS